MFGYWSLLTALINKISISSYYMYSTPVSFAYKMH